MPPVIFLTGKDGQVGSALAPVLARLGTLVAVGRKECDLANPDAIARAMREARPAIIVNAAAYTAVDKAESDRNGAYALNARAPAILADLAKEQGATLLHYSTDYVFDGAKASPYVETDPTSPVSVYGASKREGESAIRTALERHLILRTSWVFSARGSNFLKTMLKLATERESLNVVADQVGAPTPAAWIAEATAQIVARVLADAATVPYGTYHMTAGGETSWHGYATCLIEEARRLGLPVKTVPGGIKPIPASAYPAPARRPANSRLDTAKLKAGFAITPPAWQDGVATTLRSLAQP